MGVLREKGQVSIEFILIVTISMVYIYGVIWPIVDDSTSAATDIKAVADTKISAMKLANALNEASVSNGDMKKTINIFLPDGGSIECQTGNDFITYKTLVAYVGSWDSGNPAPAADSWNPDEDHCTYVPQPDPDDRPDWFECSSTVELLEPLQEDCPGTIVGSLFRKFVVQKTGGAVSIGWET